MILAFVIAELAVASVRFFFKKCYNNDDRVPVARRTQAHYWRKALINLRKVDRSEPEFLACSSTERTFADSAQAVHKLFKLTSFWRCREDMTDTYQFQDCSIQRSWALLKVDVVSLTSSFMWFKTIMPSTLIKSFSTLAMKVWRFK